MAGPAGPTGDTGPTGPTGPTGTAGSSGLYNQNSTDVAVAATDTYLTGSSLDISGHLKVGTQFHWKLFASKTASGTAVPTWNMRFGAGATVTDVARCVVTGATQTAQTDTAFFDVVGIIRAVGATCVAQMGLSMVHTVAVSGFKNDETADVKAAVSTGFDVTPANTKVGLSVNSGANGNWTFQVVSAHAINIV